MGGLEGIFSSSDGGKCTVLNRSVLEAALRLPGAADRPVVVVTVVGPPSAASSCLVSCVAQAVRGEPTAAAPPCEEDRRCAAGLAVWPELLPVQLPSGELAGLLLIEAWGPLDERCPAPDRAAALLLAAALSSVLVVQLDSADIGPLDDLGRLWELGAAAQRTPSCAPLQEVVFALRRWNGTGPTGLQAGFEPLHGWAQQHHANGRALIAMQETSDWFQSSALFLSTDDVRGGSLGGLDSPAPDLTSFLAARRAVKRFREDVLAAELAGLFVELASALGQNCGRPEVNCPALVAALVGASQKMAMRKAESRYEEIMTAMCSSQVAPMSERDVQEAHERAVHEARLVLIMTPKMVDLVEPSADMSEMLLRKCEVGFHARLQAITDESKKKEEEAATSNAKLRVRCKEQYKHAMDHALDESPLMPYGMLMKHHTSHRLQALSLFDAEQHHCGSSGFQQRTSLCDEIESMYHALAESLHRKREQAEEDKYIVSSFAKSAEAHYTDIMDVIQAEKLRDIHSKVQGGALAVFDSLSSEITSAEVRLEARRQVRISTNQRLETLCQREAGRVQRRQTLPATSRRPQSLQPARPAGSRGSCSSGSSTPEAGMFCFRF